MPRRAELKQARGQFGIAALAEGRDCLVVIPSGDGKSAVYPVAAAAPR
ncbi:MAG TPA: hypothetical protein VFE59_10395 [Trebonia sp.]|nr:hypothetical protein [Trebonia sp.]